MNVADQDEMITLRWILGTHCDSER